MKPFSSFLIFLYGGKHHEWASLQWNRTELARSVQTRWKMALTLQDLLKEDRSEDSKMRLIWNILAVLMPNHHISWRTEDFSWTWSILPFGFFFFFTCEFVSWFWFFTCFRLHASTTASYGIQSGQSELYTHELQRCTWGVAASS